MERRTFLGVAAASMLALPAVGRAASPAEEAEIRQFLADWYRLFSSRPDPAEYRAYMTDDYLLLEHGELLDVAGDMAMMTATPEGQTRRDEFDFRYLRIDGDQAYAVYFLDSEIDDSVRGPRSRRWLESALLRREGDRWRAALLHSTRIDPTAD